MSDAEIWRFIITVGTGGLAGAMASYAFSEHRRRVDLVLNIAGQYLDNFNTLHDALAILDEQPAPTTDMQNLIRKTGDWFELLAIYEGSELLDTGLLTKVGIVGQLRRFYFAVENARQNAWASNHFDEAWHWWPGVRRLALMPQGDDP